MCPKPPFWASMGFFQNCAHLTLGFWQHTIAAKNARSHPNDHLSSAFEVFSSQDEKKEWETSQVSSVEPRIGVGWNDLRDGEYFEGIWFTLLGTNISPLKGTFEDDFPFPKVGYISFVEGIHCFREIKGETWSTLCHHFVTLLVLCESTDSTLPFQKYDSRL